MTAMTAADVDTPRSAATNPPGSREAAERVAGSVRITESVALAVLGSAPLFLVVSGDPSKWKRGVIVQLVDLLLIALAAARFPTVVKGAFADRRGVNAGLSAVFAALTVALIAHPSTMGVITLLRFAGAASLVDVLARSGSAFRSRAARVWIGWTVAEAGIVVLQKGLGRAIGVPGEVGVPFETLGTYDVPTGTSYGPHPIAAMGLVAIGIALFGIHHGLVTRRWAVAGAAAGAVIVGVTCGTSGAISLIVVVAAAAIRLVSIRRRRSSNDSTRSRSAVAPLLAALLAFGTAAAFSLEGWNFKADRSVTTDVGAASNGRVGMIEEAVEMITRWPAVGVGPGRFMATRDAFPEIAAMATEDQPVHNVPLLIVTESGALGALALALGALAVARRMRGAPYALTVLAAMLGHVMFDHAPWTFGFGMVQLALVLGFATSKAAGPRRPTGSTLA